MFYYRLYSVDVADGGFIDVLHFFSQSDATAIDEVESEMLAAPKELWNRGRKVKDFPACPIPAPALDGANRLAGMVAQGGAGDGTRWPGTARSSPQATRRDRPIDVPRRMTGPTSTFRCPNCD